MKSPSHVNSKPCAHHQSCNSPCGQHRHPFQHSLFHPCFRFLSSIPPHQSHTFPCPLHPPSPINSIPHVHHCHHHHAAHYHPCLRFPLPSPPSAIHLSNAEQQSANAADAEDSVYRESSDAQYGLQGLEDKEEDWEDDPEFILTDEWLEFFAKSEAKREQAKKMKQKNRRNEQKGKHQVESC